MTRLIDDAGKLGLLCLALVAIWAATFRCSPVSAGVSLSEPGVGESVGWAELEQAVKDSIGAGGGGAAAADTLTISLVTGQPFFRTSGVSSVGWYSQAGGAVFDDSADEWVAGAISMPRQLTADEDTATVRWWFANDTDDSGGTDEVVVENRYRFMREGDILQNGTTVEYTLAAPASADSLAVHEAVVPVSDWFWDSGDTILGFFYRRLGTDADDDDGRHIVIAGRVWFH